MTNPLPSSGVLRLSDVKASMEIFDSSDLSMADPRLRAFANKKTGQIDLSDFYGMQELSAMIRAGVDDNGTAIGYYQSFWGENDRPEFGAYNLVGVYDSTPDNGLVFSVQGSQPHTTFHAIIINNTIYYEADATSYAYDAQANTTNWIWSGTKANLQQNVVYQLTYLIGNAASPSGTLPVGQGPDWTLVFEDNFTTATLDTSKWTGMEWYEAGTADGDAGIANYDQSGGYLRIWPLNNAGTWVHRYISSYGLFSQVYGYWEIKCRIPVNRGIRCVFYLMNHDTDARPIVQGLAALPGDTTGSGWADGSGHPIDYAVMVQPSNVALVSKRYSEVVPALPAIDLSTGDHVFGIKKDTSTISFYIDGTLVFSQDVTGPNVMTLSQYMVIGLDYQALTATDGTTIQNSGGAMLVDYVRAWKFGASTGGGGGNTLPSGYVQPMGQTSAKYPYLTFREDFTGSTLDTTKWASTSFYTANGKNNLAVSGGSISFWPSLPYAALIQDINAKIGTEQAFYQKYGYFEIRAKMPIGLGIQAGFTLMNHDITAVNPWIDVVVVQGGNTAESMATVGHHPQQYYGLVADQNGHTVYKVFSANTEGYTDLSLDWHTYGLEWEPGIIRWFKDGNQIGPDYTYVNTSQDLRMLLTAYLYVTNVFGQPDTTNTPVGPTDNMMLIDYIMAWGRADGKSVVEGQLPPLPESQGGKPSGGTTPTPNGIAEFYGNSTMWGYKSGVGGQVTTPPPAAFAQREPNLDVRNKAINSTTTAHWINGTNGVPAPWSTLMAQSPAQYVFLCFGVLDEFDMSTTQFKANLKTMCDAAKANNRIPVLITPFVADFTGLPAYAQAVRDCASENSYPLLELFTWSNNIVLNGTGNVRDYVPDGTHPSDQMYIDGGYELARQWDIVVASLPTTNPTTGGLTPTVPVGHPYTYTLTFQEEFDGSTLNPSVWNTHIWWNAAGEENVVNYQVSNGELHIWPQVGTDGQFHPRTIDTDGKYYQTYGFFEMEARLPVGRGCWPAFWLYNHDGVNGNPAERPEIDIMEAYPGGGPDTGQTWGTAQLHPIDFGFTLWHQNNDGVSGKIGGWRASQYIGMPDLSAGYHKYGCLWEPDGLTLFFDGVQVGSKFLTNYFSYRMYILLDLYFGSSSGTPSAAETPQGLTNAYSIRYVRAWKKN